MKRFFKGSLLALLVGLSFSIQAVPVVAPVCNEMAIATYKQEIVKSERMNMLVRSAVYVSAASAVFYLGYKILYGKPTVASPEVVTVLEKVAGDVDTLKKHVGLSDQNNKIAVSKLLDYSFLKSVGGYVRDMFFQSAATLALSTVGERVRHYAFYDASIHSFLVRATCIGRTVGDIDGYAEMLTAQGNGEAQVVAIKEILKTRYANLCSDMERMVAYMRYLEDYVKEQSKSELKLVENYLINRSNSLIASLWLSLDKDTAEEASKSIMLTVHLFKVDFEQACTRFDNAYALAQA